MVSTRSGRVGLPLEPLHHMCPNISLSCIACPNALSFYLYLRKKNCMLQVPGIFISRLVPGGLAESTGLLAVNDEVLEVNGIEVAGKSLDQVTDMMVANSSNLIITVKPVNQRMTLAPQRGSTWRGSQASSASHHSNRSSKSLDSDLPLADNHRHDDDEEEEEEEEDEDEVADHLEEDKGDKDSAVVTL